ncbi:hypothetical protein Tco_0016739 [Tanacetum coccineum]
MDDGSMRVLKLLDVNFKAKEELDVIILHVKVIKEVQAFYEGTAKVHEGTDEVLEGTAQEYESTAGANLSTAEVYESTAHSLFKISGNT